MLLALLLHDGSRPLGRSLILVSFAWTKKRLIIEIIFWLVLDFLDNLYFKVSVLDKVDHSTGPTLPEDDLVSLKLLGSEYTLELFLLPLRQVSEE